MPTLHAHAPNIFAGNTLDRLDARRKDTAWVTSRRNSPNAAFHPVWRSRNLVAGEPETPVAGYLDPALARSLLDASPWAMLGVDGERTVFALDVSSLDAPPTPEGARYEDLRRTAGLLTPDGAAILAHARGLMHWRTRSRFCNVCGAACTPRDAGHVMGCTGCGAHHFPRTDPAVIMLVTHGSRALLGHPARFREMRLFTTLAGFVEPGESLEEAVAREVWEEAGIRVGNVRYRSSQPWPFPSSIMLGFQAEATTQDITADADELVEVRWFTRDEVRAREGWILPPDMSIARRLIEEWLAQ